MDRQAVGGPLSGRWTAKRGPRPGSGKRWANRWAKQAVEGPLTRCDAHGMVYYVFEVLAAAWASFPQKTLLRIDAVIAEPLLSLVHFAQRLQEGFEDVVLLRASGTTIIPRHISSPPVVPRRLGASTAWGGAVERPLSGRRRDGTLRAASQLLTNSRLSQTFAPLRRRFLPCPLARPRCGVGC